MKSKVRSSIYAFGTASDVVYVYLVNLVKGGADVDCRRSGFRDVERSRLSR